MSYIDNGEWYVVKEDDHVSFISRGYTDESIWGRFDVPLDVFDALVMMRYAQLLEQPITMVARAIDVCGLYRNLGTEALRRWVGLPSLLEDVLPREDP